MKPQWLFLTTGLLLVGCSQKADYEPSAQSADAIEVSDTVGPDIDPAAAPGVAFDYHMTLGVPDRSISALQEKHADACEALGLSRCQIVGMRYNLVDQDSVEASLRFMLVPDIARRFAKDAVAETQKVNGKLLASDFEGDEVQTGIDQSRDRSSTAQGRLDAIERELQGKLSNDRRAGLTDEAARLRQQLVEERQTRQTGEKRLALSPLDIRYAGASVYADTPLSQIASDAGRAGKGSLALLFTALIYLVTVFVPWLLALALVVFGVRWASRWVEAWRFRREPGSSPHDPADNRPEKT